jgi:hypothetical protein
MAQSKPAKSPHVEAEKQSNLRDAAAATTVEDLESSITAGGQVDDGTLRHDSAIGYNSSRDIIPPDIDARFIKAEGVKRGLSQRRKFTRNKHNFGKKKKKTPPPFTSENATLTLKNRYTGLSFLIPTSF